MPSSSKVLTVLCEYTHPSQRLAGDKLSKVITTYFVLTMYLATQHPEEHGERYRGEDLEEAGEGEQQRRGVEQYDREDEDEGEDAEKNVSDEEDHDVRVAAPRGSPPHVDGLATGLHLRVGRLGGTHLVGSKWRE